MVCLRSLAQGGSSGTGGRGGREVRLKMSVWSLRLNCTCVRLCLCVCVQVCAFPSVHSHSSIMINKSTSLSSSQPLSALLSHSPLTPRRTPTGNEATVGTSWQLCRPQFHLYSFSYSGPPLWDPDYLPDTQNIHLLLFSLFTVHLTVHKICLQ